MGTNIILDIRDKCTEKVNPAVIFVPSPIWLGISFRTIIIVGLDDAVH